MAEFTSMQSVLTHFLPGYKQHRRLSPTQSKVCHSIGACRTEVLGGQYVHCDECDFEQHRYHSCRNRHCPKCQHHATQQWCEQQLQQVLPVNYFHVVFTLPHELNPWVQCHPDIIYRCLFQAVWRTIKRFGQEPKRLNGKMGMTAVLHTWGQNLSQHVHLHCLIPGGALSEDQTQWHHARSNYLFPVKALSKHFRGAMVSALRAARQGGELNRLGTDQVEPVLNQLMTHDWVVYSKAYLKKAETIVRYLGRYTHKIALSDSRIKEIKGDQVRFHYKDYRDHKDKCMQLDGEEFIRRFLMHVLPNGFMRIRHYGYLSNRSRRQKLDVIRSCLHNSAVPVMTDEPTADVSVISNMMCPCPKCKVGHLQIRYEIPPKYIKGEVTTCG